MLFSFSEPGFQEFETQRYPGNLLADNGFDIELGVANIPSSWWASWGSGEPVIALGSDVDGIPRASQMPGVAYRQPMIEGAPGHGEPSENPVSGGSDNIGDISWNVPTVTLRYPSNVRGLQGHHWSSAMAMATPIAHKGATTGAKVLAATMLDLIQDPSLVTEAQSYFDDIQTAEVQYEPFIAADDDPAIEKNAEIMALYRPRLEALYYDPIRYDTYLEQSGIDYPQLAPNPIQRNQ